MLTRRHLLLSTATAIPFSRAFGVPLAQFPLGVTTDEIDEDALTAIRMLKEFHLGWAEVRNVWGKYNTAQPVEKIRELRTLFDEHGIKVNTLGTGFFKVPLPGEDAAGQSALDKQWTLLNDAMERASILGTDKIRVFAFTYRNGEQPEAKAYPRIAELLREASRRAKQRGMRLALENVGQSYVWTGEQAGKVLKMVPDTNFGLTWDPNNAGQAGERSFPDGYKHLDPARIFHVHLRDFKKAASGKIEWCAVGEGMMDNLGQIRKLRKDGANCSYTLETHWKSPQGKAHATRKSLEALVKVIEQV
jgi:sugar phosphate isomerase/epimerase